MLSPESKAEFKSVMAAYLKLCPQGDCSDGPHDPIGEWDVSRVTDMSHMFYGATSFNADISKWDVSVSRATDMGRMFSDAKSFNGELSKWDVSGVEDTSYMFLGAEAFDSDLLKWDVSRVFLAAPPPCCQPFTRLFF